MMFRKSAATIDDTVSADVEPDILLDPAGLDNAQLRTYSSSLRQVGSGAASLAMGTGGIGALLTKQAVLLAKKGIERAREAGTDEAPPAEVPKGSRLRTRLVVGGSVAAALAAGAALFSWSRRRNAPPPPAQAPPSLGSSANGSGATQPAPAEVSQ